MIKAQGGEPTHRDIAADLREDIRRGRIQPGELLPSETRLHQQYGVSRLTARAAVNLLRAEGLAELRRGRGVVVREPAEVEYVTPAAGATVAARMPTPEEVEEFAIPPGTPVFAVTDGDDVTVYPADRWRLRLPS
ncbi:putative GntR-family transcriptional regulator [Actinoplanes missouriensis 431]|uniref:Putative GntR-family transcriptional regulator n=1 Tax=Actinoplanes missouriensis (strain ATCC 14538 / DSM 43046 / CBS 188.64 / JCM 3121 / NBRC 102363 / NCIMB 12654 / NRRL B-3342 / UNCC 431) TaxID=512565 RepID=I0H2D1_ACTM4|nr:GntR family transcriptional regulator [Actinoplanes missouriensis]BAL87168.1 putative GntR-family transcriptional regulator [Actinoplanes missouriensis 431]